MVFVVITRWIANVCGWVYNCTDLCYVLNPINFTHNSGVDLLGDTVGKAFVGTMCDSSNSVGLSQDNVRDLVEQVGSTAAHELGHILNMGHDSGKCICLRHFQYELVKSNCTLRVFECNLMVPL